MSERKRYTPGPWEGSGPYSVPSTGKGDIFSGGDWEVYPPLGESGPVALVNNEANARLIAAAPELVELAEELLLTHVNDISPPLYQKGKALLAKIYGDET